MKKFFKEVVEKYKKLGIWGLVIENIVIMGIMIIIFSCISANQKTSTSDVISVDDVSDSEEYIETEAEHELITAVEKLKGLDNYIIANYIEDPSGLTSYIEVIDNGASYTKVSASATPEGYVRAYQEKGDDGVFVLSDYIDSNDNMVIIDTTDNVNFTYYTAPKSYGTLLRSRDILYIDRMIGNMTDAVYLGNFTIDIGNGDEALDVYEFKIPSEVVESIMCSGTYDLYDSLREANRDNVGLVKILTWYLNDLDPALTFSYGNVVAGVDSNGVLKYTEISCGGIGQMMYATKCVILDDTSENIAKPDLSSAVDYVTVFGNVPEIAEDFDSMSELLSYIRNQGIDTNSDLFNYSYVGTASQDDVYDSSSIILEPDVLSESSESIEGEDIEE